jgi:hypothetical protein
VELPKADSPVTTPGGVTSPFATTELETGLQLPDLNPFLLDPFTLILYVKGLGFISTSKFLIDATGLLITQVVPLLISISYVVASVTESQLPDRYDLTVPSLAINVDKLITGALVILAIVPTLDGAEPSTPMLLG